MSPGGIGDWPRRRAVKSRGQVAVRFRDRSETYDELADRVDRLAAALQSLGVGPTDRVAFLGNNHPSFIESIFAVTTLGAVFVPLNTRLSAPELAYMLDDSGAKALISTSQLESLAAAATTVAAANAVLRIVVDDGGDRDTTSPREDCLDFETLIASARSAPAGLHDVSLDDRAMIIYTSGTTGTPKGAVLTHGNLTWNAINVLVDYDIASTDRALMVSPLFHVASLGMGCLPMLLKGATVLLEERFVPAEALRSIQRLEATTISGVPTTFQLMTEDPAWESTDISSLRLMTCGGSVVPDRVREAYEKRGLAFSGGYGMTESAPGITLLPPWHTADHPESAGLAHFFTRFRIGDGGSADAGASGEIEATGPNVFLEYWGRPNETIDAFTADGWLKTGRHRLRRRRRFPLHRRPTQGHDHLGRREHLLRRGGACAAVDRRCHGRCGDRGAARALG